MKDSKEERTHKEVIEESVASILVAKEVTSNPHRKFELVIFLHEIFCQYEKYLPADKEKQNYVNNQIVEFSKKNDQFKIADTFRDVKKGMDTLEEFFKNLTPVKKIILSKEFEIVIDELESEVLRLDQFISNRQEESKQDKVVEEDSKKRMASKEDIPSCITRKRRKVQISDDVEVRYM